jgi:hypothetical protein
MNAIKCLSLLAVSAIAVPSCGGQRRVSSTSAEPATVAPGIAERQAAIAALESELAAPMQMATPNCEKACPLAEKICTLADEICVLASKTPTDTTGAASCTDSKLRCDTARKRVAESCTCVLAPKALTP